MYLAPKHLLHLTILVSALAAPASNTQRINRLILTSCNKQVTPTASQAKWGNVNPVALGVRSAIVHGMPSLLPAPKPAYAFSGSKSMPPIKWHERFFGGSRDGGSLRLGTPDQRRQSSDREEHLRERPTSTRRRPRLFGTSASVAIAGSSSAVGLKSALRPLSFWESMVCGAISRSVAQTVTHPANAMKTILQAKSASGGVGSVNNALSLSTLVRPSNLHLLTRGAGAMLLLSLPQGAVNFAVLEYIRKRSREILCQSPFGESLERNGAVAAGLDFFSSASSTICCSVISGPISVLTDNIMAGNYPNLPEAVSGIADKGGLSAFYTGWWPQMAGKIPSYGLTWVCFQRLKEAHQKLYDGRTPTDVENCAMGCIASGLVVTLMMPMDTIKTRIITQRLSSNLAGVVPYGGMRDCAVRMLEEEGLSSFYRGLTPRLASVMPTVGIQFGVYECMKRICLERSALREKSTKHGPKARRQARRRGRNF